MMNDPILLRIMIFLGLFALIVIWEIISPRHLQSRQRWQGNIGLFLAGVLLLRVLFPLTAVGAAILAQEKGWGLLNAVSWEAAGIIIAVVLLDLAIYWQHRLSHMIPFLWRLHRVHHADGMLDVTTALRFHPLEIALSMAYKIGVVILLGAPLMAVILFEIILNGTALFNHGNIKIPPAVDRCLRWIVVTPDMHRVHHSISGDETNRNYGFNLPIWDRIFGSYQAEPQAGLQNTTIGLPLVGGYFTCSRFTRMLMLPFQKLMPTKTL